MMQREWLAVLLSDAFSASGPSGAVEQCRGMRAIERRQNDR
jgi:hypothetical protein